MSLNYTDRSTPVPARATERRGKAVISIRLPGERRQTLTAIPSTREPESTFHSQFGEDQILARLFADTKVGTCVDVGAHDGIQLSNSYYFEQIGWHCVLVEPAPHLCAGPQLFASLNRDCGRNAARRKPGTWPRRRGRHSRGQWRSRAPRCFARRSRRRTSPRTPSRASPRRRAPRRVLP
jgi:hypothetical protein